MRVSASVVVDRPITDVFAYATNPECWPEWLSGLSHAVTRCAQPLYVGATFDHIARGGGYGRESSWEVTEHEPPRVLGCRRIAGAGPAAIRQVFEAMGNSTRLTISSDGDGTGPFAEGPDLERAIMGQLERDLGRLKQALERRGTTVGQRGGAG